MEEKKLYIVKKDEDTKVTFSIAKIYEETETEYVTSTDFGWLIKGAGWNFPKKMLNKNLDKGFVTDKFNYKKIKEQIEKMHEELDKEHKEFIDYYNRCIEVNDDWYKQCLLEIDRINQNK